MTISSPVPVFQGLSITFVFMRPSLTMSLFYLGASLIFIFFRESKSNILQQKEEEEEEEEKEEEEEEEEEERAITLPLAPRSLKNKMGILFEEWPLSSGMNHC